MISYQLNEVERGYNWVFVDDVGEIHEGCTVERDDAIEELGREFADEVTSALFAQLDEIGFGSMGKRIEHGYDSLFEEAVEYFEDREGVNND